MDNLDHRRREMRRRVRADRADAFAKGWLAGSQETEEWLTRRSPVGRRSTVPVEVRQRMERWRTEGLSYAAIAERLNAEGVPTGQGGRQWWPSSVRYALNAR